MSCATEHDGGRGDTTEAVAVTSEALSSAGASASAAGRGASEEARLRKFLDDRYGSKDVQHSFTTAFGETIDCVDFAAQPGVKAALANGIAVDEPPRAAAPASTA